MEENNVMNEVSEAVAEVDSASMNDEQLKGAIEETLSKIRNQSMIIGYRVACQTIIDMIQPWHNPHASHNDFKRLFKKVEEFCGKALKQPENGVQNVTDTSTVQN